MKRGSVYSIFVIILLISIFVYEELNVYQTTEDMKSQAEQTVIESNKNLPPNEFTQDGCTLFPNKIPWHDFRPACLEHDISYWAGGTEEEKRAADIALRETISHTGPIGPVFGHIMYAGVKVFGDSWLTKKVNANWGYGWDEQT